MRKVKKIFVPILVLLLDFTLVIVSFLLGYLFRYGANIPKASFDPFKESFLALALIYVLAFAFAGLFRRRFSSHWQLVKKVSYGMVIGTLFSFAFMYAFRIKWSPFPSSLFVLAVPTGIILISATNLIVHRVARTLKTNIVIVGGNVDEEVFINRLRIEIYHAKNIEDILQYTDIDEILICEHIEKDSQLNLLIYLLNQLKVNVSFKPNLYADLLSESIKQKNTLKFLATSIGRKSDLEEFLIIFVDIFGSAALLVLAAVPMLIISILIKLTSKGPVVYKQERAGKNSTPFILYKFRTMGKDAEKHLGLTPATVDEPRVTKLGKFLRKARLDELPQLFNIL
ncbi:MAG: sugar transferase, partial [Candidatus Heimdallarchaeota archaeon]|nr:sugar transferase [Candidatus Heimdallarchaeota archaeon]